MRDDDIEPKPPGYGPYARAGLEVIGGALPFVGGILAAGASFWSEREQQAINDFLRAQIAMMHEELREKQRVLGEVVARIDIHDEQIKNRIRSDEYQSILKKAFRNWAGTESQKKQEYVRNLLSNAAATTIVSDDVIMLFLDWLQRYSEFHFAVVGEIYRNKGTTRGRIWSKLGRRAVREDSADADLFKLLIRDLSTGGVIRQHRETDYAGNFVAKKPSQSRGNARAMTSAFDNEDQYELTALGSQFVHYVMTELTPKITYTATSGTAPVGEGVA